jgi:myo-inositol 2-dehydrogenase/D-chiro-inositol 1-dehydrogenase
MLNIALLGAGLIGAMHAANIKASPHARLAWVADPAPGAAERVSRGGAKTTRDPLEAIAAPDADAVWIATPNNTHVDFILAAVAAGKPVFCEKPVDADLGRARDCLARVEAAGGRAMIGFNRRFDPTFAEVIDRAAAGEVGPVWQVSIYARDPEPPPLAYIPGSGGLFCDMSIHDFDLARALVGEIAAVHAIGQDTDPGVKKACDAGAGVTLLHARSGAVAAVFNSRTCAFGYDQRLEVFGETGMLQARTQTPTSVAASGAARTEALGRIQDHYTRRFAASYRLEVEAFAAAAEAGSPLTPSVADGVAALAIAAAAAESASTGQTVTLD